MAKKEKDETTKAETPPLVLARCVRHPFAEESIFYKEGDLIGLTEERFAALGDLVARVEAPPVE